MVTIVYGPRTWSSHNCTSRVDLLLLLLMGYFLQENTTWDLVSDLEKLREHLGVTKWVVLGGCWGATLALSYALKHPDPVKALIIGGIFTLKRYAANTKLYLVVCQSYTCT